MKFIKKLLGRIRKCQFCGDEYNSDEAKYIRSRKVDVEFYRDNYTGKVKITTNRKMHECCMECHRKNREKEDLRYGITPEMREESERLRKEQYEQLVEARKIIDEYKNK